MERTHRWLKRCVAAKGGDQMLFGIIQGGQFKDLRAQSASFVAAQDTEGIGIGGSFGKKGMSDVLEWIHPYFPENKPRHLLGIGTVPDILAGVKWGMDLFDCVVPQMIARMGYIHLLPQSGGTRDKWFSYRLTKAQFQEDDQPLDPNCGCKMCAMYSRAYVHHLFDLKEYTGKRIATYHNLYFILNLMKKIRVAIANGTFNQLYQQWMSC
jgi:queuine tRNA-ribosyltransferase